MPIIFSHVHHVFGAKTPFEYHALHDVNLEIEKGSFVAIVGRTGSGKSTLIQHINALLRPSEGEVRIDDFLNGPKNKLKGKPIKALREKVGMVFQFPEYQLFEENVEKDVAFAPKNFGMKEKEALEKAHEALAKVGLGEEFYARSPFELSGGEKRRVAIAGILAASPSYLIVDEPTAGLDPSGAAKLMGLFKEIHEAGTTIVLVTHDMDLVMKYCNRVIVIDNGKVAMETTPNKLFDIEVEKYSLETPLLLSFTASLIKGGLPINEDHVTSISELAREIARVKKK